MQGLFLSSTRENTGLSACEKRSFTMEWQAYLAKPERIKKNALFRKNVSALLHFEVEKACNHAGLRGFDIHLGNKMAT